MPHRGAQDQPKPPRRRTPGKPGGPLGPESPASDRSAQVAAEVRRALQSEIGRGLNDPRVQGIVSVTEVSLSPDLSEARVRVSVLPEERASLTLSGLRAASGFLRRRVMDGTRIGRVPRLLFEVDERLKRQSALDAALRTSHAEADAGSVERPSPTGGAALGPEESHSR